MRATSLFPVLVAALSIAGTALGNDPPASELNLLTGKIETVDTVADTGQNDIRLTISDSAEGSIQIVTDDPEDERNPKIDIDESTGDVWVTWWRDAEVNSVHARKRSAQGEWGPEISCSEENVDSSNPAIVAHEGAAWIGFEAKCDASCDGTQIVVHGVIDDPDPVSSPTKVATTGCAHPSIGMSAEDMHVWITWVDSADEVGWSEFDAATSLWSLPRFEPLGAAGLGAARQAIRSIVLGLED